MTFDEYQELAMTFCTKESNNLPYMILGLNEEVGELTGNLAKAVRKGLLKPDLTFDEDNVSEEHFELMDNITKECGDVLWMLAGVHSVLNKRLETTAHLNIHKLTSRKNRGVIVGEGDNR